MEIDAGELPLKNLVFLKPQKLALRKPKRLRPDTE